MSYPVDEYARVLTADRALETLERPWREQEPDWTGDPSATWVWLETGLRRIDRQEVLVLGAAERPVACLYLAGKNSRLAFPVSRVLDRFAWAPSVREPEIEAALGAARRLAAIYLPYVPVSARPPLLGTGDTRPAGVCPLVAATEWSAYHARLPGTLRKALHRAEIRVAKSGTRLRATELRRGETSERLAELAAVEARGHRRRGRLLSGKRAKFIGRVIEAIDSAGHVRTHVIEDSRGVCAFLLGFAVGGRYLLYSTSLDARYERLSLGTLVLRDALRGALERGEDVDMGNGSTRFKLRWATGVLPLESVLLLPPADNCLAPRAASTAPAPRRVAMTRSPRS
jgi:hypothetical protein